MRRNKPRKINLERVPSIAFDKRDTAELKQDIDTALKLVAEKWDLKYESQGAAIYKNGVGTSHFFRFRT